MLLNLKRLTALSLSLTLVGCAAMPPLPEDATPSQRMAYATERHLTQETSYNFHYNLKVDELSYAPDAADDAADASTNLALDDEQGFATTAELAKVDELTQTFQRVYRTIKTVTQGLNIDAEGAVDLRRGKFEVIPAVRYQAPNVYAKIKLPLLLDLGQNSLYVDPSAITNMPLDSELLAQYRQPAGTFYRVTLAEQQAWADIKAILTEIPPSDLTKLYVDSYAKSLAKLPAERIQMVAVDAWGQSLGAQQQILLTLSLSEYLNYSMDLQLNLIEAAIAYLQGYQGSALPEHLVAAVKNLDAEAQQLPRELFTELLEKLANEASAEANALLTDASQLATVQALYLDQNHRLLGQLDGLKVNIKGARLDVSSRVRYSHFGRPQWQINPNKVTVIDSKVTLLTDEAWATLVQSPASNDEADATLDDEDLKLSLEEAIAAAAQEAQAEPEASAL